MTKRILITGGAGVLGFQLAKKMLSEGYIVCLTDNLARGVHDDDFKLLLDNPRISVVFQTPLRTRWRRKPTSA
ncbi:MAG TPA: hypothetical protein EYQ00_10465 [Dehalococcoidia bacterium]|nr:hypothetical protein [Dehalococcoidia bacterium]